MKININVIKSIYGWLLDTLFPQVCLRCQSGNQILCLNCIPQIQKNKMGIKEGIYACFDYRDPLIKKIIWNLKYYNRFSLGDTIGRLIYEVLYKEIDDIKKDNQNSPIYVIPVPISKNRQKKRGYNQAEMIARGFCMCEENTFKLKNNLITKNIDTIQQARIEDRTKRFKNVRGAFKVPNPSLIKDKTIIVIDDVITTGGTINEIMKTLHKSGARKVLAFAVAH